MEQKEMYFSDLNRYPKTGGTPLDDVEAFKRERGFVDLDDPEQKRKYLSGDKVRFNPALEEERKVGIKRAKREYKAALKNLHAKSAPKKKTPQSILQAAYREFKRVAKDAGATIDQVLAAKNKQ